MHSDMLPMCVPVQNLVGNTHANLQLIYNKLVDHEHIPAVASDANTLIQGWLSVMMARHPELDREQHVQSVFEQQPQPYGSSRSHHQQQQQQGVAEQGEILPDVSLAPSSSTSTAGSGGFGGVSGSGESCSRFSNQQQQQQQQETRAEVVLDIHITGHSLGAMLAEVATVESRRFAEKHGISWRCTSFECPGLPDVYMRSALRQRPRDYWNAKMTSYLAAPNPINMLYKHLGALVHVVVPWEHTWSHATKCLAADVCRVAGWVVVGSMVAAAVGRVQAGAGRGRGTRLAATAASGAHQLLGQGRRDGEEEGVGGGAAGVAAARELLGGFQLGPPGAAAAGVTGGVRRQGLQPLGLGPTGGLVIGSVAEGRRLRSATREIAAAAGGSSSRDAVAVGVAAAMGAVANAANAAAVASGSSSSTVGTLASTAAAAANGGGGGNAGLAAVIGYVAAVGEYAASAGCSNSLSGVIDRVAGRSLGLPLWAMLGWALRGGNSITGVLKCVAGVLGVEVDELWEQHRLGAMRPCFDPHTGELQDRYRRMMKTWPQLGNR